MTNTDRPQLSRSDFDAAFARAADLLDVMPAPDMFTAADHIAEVADALSTWTAPQGWLVTPSFLAPLRSSEVARLVYSGAKAGLTADAVYGAIQRVLSGDPVPWRQIIPIWGASCSACLTLPEGLSVVPVASLQHTADLKLILDFSTGGGRGMPLRSSFWGAPQAAIVSVMRAPLVEFDADKKVWPQLSDTGQHLRVMSVRFAALLSAMLGELLAFPYAYFEPPVPLIPLFGDDTCVVGSFQEPSIMPRRTGISPPDELDAVVGDLARIHNRLDYKSRPRLQEAALRFHSALGELNEGQFALDAAVAVERLMHASGRRAAIRGAHRAGPIEKREAYNELVRLFDVRNAWVHHKAHGNRKFTTGGRARVVKVIARLFRNADTYFSLQTSELDLGVNRADRDLPSE